MSSEEITKKWGVFRDILNSKYGAFGLVAILYYTMGKLPPAEAAQARAFIKDLNNPIGWCLAAWLLLVFINENFWQPYIAQKMEYTAAIQEFRSMFSDFSSSCEAQVKAMTENSANHNETMNTLQNGMMEMMAQQAEMGGCIKVIAEKFKA